MGDWRYPGFAPEVDELNPCDGCHDCGMRCSAGIQMTAPEFEQIVAHLRTVDPHHAFRVLEQDKQVVWFEEISREACLFYDVVHRGCLVYPARPLICRLFGRVEWLPCPQEKPLLPIRRGVEIIQTYAGEARATFGEWCSERGHFDLRRLLTSG